MGKAVKYESCLLKVIKILSALILVGASAACCVYFWAGVNNVVNIQDYCTQLAPEFLNTTTHGTVTNCTNTTLYDVNFYSGPYTDYEAANNTMYQLTNCDEECISLGNGWSHALNVCGVAFATVAAQSILAALAVCITPLRFGAVFTQPFVVCFLLAAIITLSVFRFNQKG